MADFSEWMREMYSAQDKSCQLQQPTNSYSPASRTSFSSWSSDNDTDSDSESSHANFMLHPRRKTNKAKELRMHSLAAPVVIPARTHDFGWCDQDEYRGSRSECACGNDCAEFFSDDASHSACNSIELPSEDASDELIFDLEM